MFGWWVFFRQHIPFAPQNATPQSFNPANPSPSSGHWGSPAPHLVLHGCGGAAGQGSVPYSHHHHPRHHPRRRRVSPPRRPPRRQAPPFRRVAPLPLGACPHEGHAPPAPPRCSSPAPAVARRGREGGGAEGGGAEGGAGGLGAENRWRLVVRRQEPAGERNMQRPSAVPKSCPLVSHDYCNARNRNLCVWDVRQLAEIKGK